MTDAVDYGWRSMPAYDPHPRYGFRSPPPRQIVIHSCETPLTAGIATSLAGANWFGGPQAGTSAHGMADPASGVSMVATNDVAWHCGTGNDTSVGFEHAGRAAFTTAEWMTADGIKMLQLSAQATAKVAKAYGIPAVWLSVTQVANNVQGFCTHNDMRLARGGTTHTDPGPGFPYAQYMAWVKAAMTGTTPPPTSPPNEGDVLDMDAKELSDLIDQRLKVALGNDYANYPLSKNLMAGPPSTRAASKVRDMEEGGTKAIYQHVLSGNEKMQLLCDHFGIKLPASDK